MRSVCTKNWKIRLIENAVKIIHGGTPSSGSGTQKSSSNHGFHFWRTAVERLKPLAAVVGLVGGPHHPHPVGARWLEVEQQVDGQHHARPRCTSGAVETRSGVSAYRAA